MSLPTDNRLHKVRIQLNLKIPDGCSLSASQCLHSSLRQKFNTNFKGVPLFQVYIQGLGTQLWTLDAKLDNGVVLTCGGLRNKIRTTIQQAFEDVLSELECQSFRAWFKKIGKGTGEWLRINQDNEPFPGVPSHFWGVMRDSNELPDFTPDYAEACFGVDAGPTSGGGGQSAAAPAAATALGAAATPALSFPAVDPAAPYRGVDRAVAVSCCEPQQAFARGTPASVALAGASSGAAVPPRLQELTPPLPGPASGGGGRMAVPVAATAPGAAATPAVSFPAGDPEAPALARGTPAAAAESLAAGRSAAAAAPRSQKLSPPRAGTGAVVCPFACGPQRRPRPPSGGQGRRPFRLRQQDGPEDGAHV